MHQYSQASQQPDPTISSASALRVVGKSPTLAKKVANDASRNPITHLSSQERQRVRRACEGCRKRKIKCNGEEPCQRCLASETECEYANFVIPLTVAASHVERLESRVASIESLFRQFLDTFGAADGRSSTILLDVAEISKRVGRDNDGLVGISGEDNDILRSGEDDFAGNNVDCQFEGQFDNNRDQEGAPETVAPPEKQTYADGFGELEVDTNGQLRYVGLGSTASVVDTCVGLRKHISQGLEKKGYNEGESFFTSPVPINRPSTLQQTLNTEMPPPALVDLLVEIYFKELSFLFPIILETDVRSIREKLLHEDINDFGCAAIFFGVLAVAAPLIPKTHEIFRNINPKYRDRNMGTSFYNLGHYFANSATAGTNAEQRDNSQNIVLALGLLCIFLAATGSQAESWIMVGRAIRLGQDLGLHRSPERLRLPLEERSKRQTLWWCLYIHERHLSIALGRPLSIDDADCDVEIPSGLNDGQYCKGTEGFISMIHLSKILGGILRTVNSVKNADSWRKVMKYEELRVRVRELNIALHSWAKDQVLLHIKKASSGMFLTQKHIALSSFFSGVILLHRVYMSNPHRPSPLENSQAQLQSAKAATDCIRGTPEFLRSVPKSHYLVFHGQYVFASAIVLLQCVRSSDDLEYATIHLKDVDLALECLQSLEDFWKGAKKCHGIIKEYLEFTLNVLNDDKKGVCNFPHDCEEVRGKKVSREHENIYANHRKDYAPRSDMRSLEMQTSPSAMLQSFGEKRPSKRRKAYHDMSPVVVPNNFENQDATHSRNRHTQLLPSFNTMSRTTNYTGQLQLPQPLVDLPTSEITSPYEGAHFDDLIDGLLGTVPNEVPLPLQSNIFSGFSMDFSNKGLPSYFR